MLYSLNIAGSEWFILLIAIIIILIPTKITSISKTIGKFVGEYEKAKKNLINEKDNLLQQTTNHLEYRGPNIQRPVSSEREKLEIIAKSLQIDIENRSEDDLRNLISTKLKETHS
ncbi:MAG: translocase [Nitrosopumilus sp.]|nr:translocase [Nitrosopumilus sp.]